MSSASRSPRSAVPTTSQSAISARRTCSRSRFTLPQRPAGKPDDGSDIIEGQAGTDALAFNGANIAESFDISANGPRARLSRNVGAVVMDLNSIEQIKLTALGGADTITVNDLGGTDVKQVAV